MTMTITNPYADTFDAYWQAGWRGVLPLPYRAKKLPPTGYTGYDYREPSYADCSTWAQDGQRNICLHLPKGVIGIDVDAYGDKPGAETLQALVQECGALPATWMSSSRGDGISGIRLFRIPEDVRLVPALPGIEMIQYFHRYVVCWPSVHPDTGGIYEWVNEATGEAGDLPVLDQLPMLPERWLAELTDTGERPEKAVISAEGVREFMAGLPSGDPCRHVVAAAGLAMRGGARHDTYNHAVLGVLARGRSGCPGARLAYERLHKAFLSEVTVPGDGQRSRQQAELEWGRNALGAIALAVKEHPEQGASCPDDYIAELILAEQAAKEQPEPDTDEEQPQQTEEQEQKRQEAEYAYRVQVARKAAELQLLDDARDILATRKAGKAPDLTADPLPVFLAQPDEVVPYRIDGLWPVNGRVLLAAAAKAGKTTLVMNLLKALADGGLFLGCYGVEPMPEGRSIVYLNMEVSPAQIRRWLRRAGIDNGDTIHVVNLRGQASALTLGTEQGRQRVAEWLRSLNAGMVILDPLAPLLAALNVDENNNSEVARFFGLWSETLALADVGDDLIVHHTGHAGQRSRGAARFLDEPDALWTISKDTAVDEDGDDIYEAIEPRFFKATGRDVEQPEQSLEFNSSNGELSLGTGNRKVIRAATKKAAAQARVLAAIDDGNRSKRTIIKVSGNEKENAEALDDLVMSGILWLEKVGGAHLYSRVSPVSPSVASDMATVGVASLYKATPATAPRQSPEKGRCDDCLGDTRSAGLKLCPDCEKKRRAGK